MRFMNSKTGSLVFIALALILSLLFAGCLSQETSSPTAIPSTAQTPTPLPTVLPSASPAVIVEIPTAEPEETNYSQTQVVTQFFNAVSEKKFEKAYSLVSRDFKVEDPDAANLEAFKARLESDFPAGVSLSNARLAEDNREHSEVLVDMLKGGETRSSARSFIVSFESGLWKMRIPFPTKGLYYNKKTAFVYNSQELSRLFALALNDFFSPKDNSLYSKPLEFSLFDSANKVYFMGRKMTFVGGDGVKRFPSLDVNFGPAGLFLSNLPSAGTLSSGRTFYFEFTGSQITGGNGGLYCYESTARKYLFYFKADGQLAMFLNASDNLFYPLFSAFEKACPQ